MTFTRHAKERCQERGIPLQVAELIVEFGTVCTPADETCRYELRQRDKEAAIRQLRQKLQDLEKSSGKVVVLGGDRIITAYRDHT